jgi:orotate phosphoribosyltransferase
MDWNDLKRHFAIRMFELGVFKDKGRSPGGQGFRLKLHKTKPEAPLSPFYLDFRLLRSSPNDLLLSAKIFEMMIFAEGWNPDFLADIPTAITPTVTVLSQRLQMGMITPREAKDHGSGAEIDGIYKEQMSGVLFDDVITGADSKFSAHDTLTSADLRVQAIAVLADRGQGGAEQLQTAGIEFRAAFTVDWLLEFYQREALISETLFKEIQVYRGR